MAARLGPESVVIPPPVLVTTLSGVITADTTSAMNFIKNGLASTFA